MVFFLKVWFTNGSNKKIRFFIILFVCAAFLHMHVKTPDHREAIRGCIRHKFLYLIKLILVRIFRH